MVHSEASENEKQEKASALPPPSPKVKEYVAELLLPQKSQGQSNIKQYSIFLEVFACLGANIPLLECLKEMPAYVRSMKERLLKKENLEE
ncbi:hypothetical protein PIB30_103203, partial [Stylosanthes scabra]|nr:hypothetical protein [Stylosanthes scabra]